MALDLNLLNHVWKRTEKEQSFARYNRPIKEARPFSLDDAAVEMVAEMSSGENRHKMIPLYREMAHLPFPTTWIELDFHCLHRWRMERGTVFPGGSDIDEIMEEIDSGRELFGKPTRLGFLCDTLSSASDCFRVTTFGIMTPQPGVTVRVESDRDPKAHVFPLVHMVTTGEKITLRMARGGYTDKFPDLCDSIDRLNDESILSAMTWGMQRNTTRIDWLTSPLYKTNGVEPEPIFIEHAYNSREHHTDTSGAIASISSTLFQSAKEQKGDLRFLVAALALLNHVPVTFKQFRPKGQLLAKSQMKPFLTSNTVTIQVPNSRRRLKFIDDHIKMARAHSRHRRHEVRAHLRTANRQINDKWKWTFIPGPTPGTGKWSWALQIESHFRGDAALGWVDHYYSVEGKNRYDKPKPEDPDDHPRL